MAKCLRIGPYKGLNGLQKVARMDFGGTNNSSMKTTFHVYVLPILIGKSSVWS